MAPSQPKEPTSFRTDSARVPSKPGSECELPRCRGPGSELTCQSRWVRVTIASSAIARPGRGAARPFTWCARMRRPRSAASREPRSAPARRPTILSALTASTGCSSGEPCPDSSPARIAPKLGSRTGDAGSQQSRSIITGAAKRHRACWRAVQTDDVNVWPAQLPPGARWLPYSPSRSEPQPRVCRRLLRRRRLRGAPRPSSSGACSWPRAWRPASWASWAGWRPACSWARANRVRFFQGSTRNQTRLTAAPSTTRLIPPIRSGTIRLTC